MDEASDGAKPAPQREPCSVYFSPAATFYRKDGGSAVGIVRLLRTISTRLPPQSAMPTIGVTATPASMRWIEARTHTAALRVASEEAE